MKDEQLDPVYVKRRQQLKELVASIIRPKIVQGKLLNGQDFVAFLEQVALFIPTFFVISGGIYIKVRSKVGDMNLSLLHINF